MGKRRDPNHSSMWRWRRRESNPIGGLNPNRLVACNFRRYGLDSKMLQPQGHCSRADVSVRELAPVVETFWRR